MTAATIPAHADLSGPLLRMLGRVEHVPTFDAMRAFTEARTPDTPDELWLCEHPPVFTQGVAGRPEHVLGAGSIPVVATNRGGQVTFHGPGQVAGGELRGGPHVEQHGVRQFGGGREVAGAEARTGGGGGGCRGACGGAHRRAGTARQQHRRGHQGSSESGPFHRPKIRNSPELALIVDGPVEPDWACPPHHWPAGTRAFTAATCWPQPVQVVLPQVRQVVGLHMGGLLHRGRFLHYTPWGI